VHTEGFSATVASIVHTFLVILVTPNTLARELLPILILGTLVHAVPPFLDTTKDEVSTVLGAILAHVALSRVMQDTTDDAVQSTINVNILVIPSFH
jgi:hypothetical protein